jgi:DNA invertase Pin-like site-specific DNA recombinase
VDVARRPLRVALYARVSTRAKDQDPELQLQPLREYAAVRGWQTTEYVDYAPAADLAGRTAWARLLESVRRRRVDHVLAWKLDRPFRSTLHCLRTLEDLAHRGVGFACLTQEIDTTSPTGRLLLTVLAAVAEFERGLLAERVREGMTNARRKGVRLGRPAALERPHVARQWPAVRAQLAAGVLSKRAAARRLQVGQATLARLLAAPPGAPKGEGAAAAPAPE